MNRKRTSINDDNKPFKHITGTCNFLLFCMDGGTLIARSKLQGINTVAGCFLCVGSIQLINAIKTTLVSPKYTAFISIVLATVILEPSNYYTQTHAQKWINIGRKRSYIIIGRHK